MIWIATYRTAPNATPSVVSPVRVGRDEGVEADQSKEHRDEGGYTPKALIWQVVLHFELWKNSILKLTL